MPHDKGPPQTRSRGKRRSSALPPLGSFPFFLSQKEEISHCGFGGYAIVMQGSLHYPHALGPVAGMECGGYTWTRTQPRKGLPVHTATWVKHTDSIQCQGSQTRKGAGSMSPCVPSSRTAPLTRMKTRKVGWGGLARGRRRALEMACLFAGGDVGALRAIPVSCALLQKFYLNKKIVRF